MVLPFQVALFSGVSVAALMASAGADAYAVGGNAPEFVADFAGVLNSGTEYYRSGGSDTTFSSVFTHSGLVLPATMTDSDGALKWGAHNLLRQSQSFDDSVWAKTRSTISANATTAPDGTLTADLLIPSTDNGSHHMLQALPATVSGLATQGVWVKYGGNEDYVGLTFSNNVTYAVIFRLSTQTFSSIGANVIDYGFSDAGNGWYYVWVQCDGSHGFIQTYVLNGPSFSAYVGDNVNGIYFWGAHCYRSDLGGMVNNPDRGDSYVPTTTAARYLPRRNHYIYNGSTYDNAGILIEPAAATNLATYSNDFTNAAWSTNAANETLTASASTGPDGATSMTRLNDDSGTGTGEVYVDQSVTVATSTAYTFSVYAKADQLSWIALGAENFTTPANGESFFNLSAGTVGTAATGHTARIENVASGIYRCSITFTTDASDTSGNIRIYVADADTDITVDRDGTSSVYIYGAQFEAGSVTTSYIPVVAGSTVTRAAETLTVAGSSLPANTTGVSVQMQGRMTYADLGTEAQRTFWRWYNGASDFLLCDLDTDGADTGEVNANQSDTSGGSGTVAIDAYSPGINVAYNIASRHSNTDINLAVDGTAGTADATPTALHDASSDTFQVAHNLQGSVGMLRVWGVGLSDTDLEGAS